MKSIYVNKIQYNSVSEFSVEHPEITISKYKFWWSKNIYPIKLFMGKSEGWRGYIPFYLVWCKKHIVFHITYPIGFNQVFICDLPLKKFNEFNKI